MWQIKRVQSCERWYGKISSQSPPPTAVWDTAFSLPLCHEGQHQSVVSWLSMLTLPFCRYRFLKLASSGPVRRLFLNQESQMKLSSPTSLSTLVKTCLCQVAILPHLSHVTWPAMDNKTKKTAKFRMWKADVASHLDTWIMAVHSDFWET